MDIRIGCRNTALAIWHAREVGRELQNVNYRTEIFTVNPTSQDRPVHTNADKASLIKNLFEALKEDKIDVAVYPSKDLPAILPDGIEVIACLKRDYAEDVLVRSPKCAHKPLRELKIATDDPRRKAFWLKEFPGTEFVPFPGNASARLEMLEKNEVDAGIFSLARLKRLNLNPAYETLPFLLPSPGQGFVVVLGRADNQEVNPIFESVNDPDAAFCAANEKAFQKVFLEVEGFAVGAYSEIMKDQFRLQGCVVSFDGKNALETDDVFPVDASRNYGKEMGEQILKNGGADLLINSVLA